MSRARGKALPPAASISLAAVWMVPGSLACGSVVLPVTTMLAPSRAARSAMARPIPRLQPVMNRVFPASVDMGALYRAQRGARLGRQGFQVRGNTLAGLGSVSGL